LNKKFLKLFWEIGCQILLGIIEVCFNDSFVPDIYEGHFILSERTGFIGANHGRATHGFAS
jgi:hypothetical protein